LFTLTFIQSIDDDGYQGNRRFGFEVEQWLGDKVVPLILLELVSYILLLLDASANRLSQDLRS
jgi:hypothetical protein